MKRKKKSSLSILALLISPRDPDFSVFSILLQKKRCFWLHDLQKENRREKMETLENGRTCTGSHKDISPQPGCSCTQFSVSAVSDKKKASKEHAKALRKRTVYAEEKKSLCKREKSLCRLTSFSFPRRSKTLRLLIVHAETG